MRKLLLITLLIMTGIVSTGCIKAVMRLNPDGSGKLEIGFNLSIQDLSEAGELSDDGSSDTDGLLVMLETGKPLIDEETGIAITVEERLENASMWTYIIMDVPTLEAWSEIDAASERLLPEGDDNAGDPIPTDPSSLAVTPNITVDGSTVRVELTVPSMVDPDMEAEEDPFGLTEIFNIFLNVAYEIEMPGTLGEHNGQIDTLTGNPVWIIDITSPDDLEIVVESVIE